MLDSDPKLESEVVTRSVRPREGGRLCLTTPRRSLGKDFRIPASEVRAMEMMMVVVLVVILHKLQNPERQ